MALQKLHDLELVHRDIKPSNIIFVGGKPKLADIGLVVDSKAAGTFVGTEGFIPPEGPGTAQADVYALGKVLYEMAMGQDRLQFPVLPDSLPDGSEREKLMKFNRVVLKACHHDVRRRYKSAEEMRKDLERLGKRLNKLEVEG